MHILADTHNVTRYVRRTVLAPAQHLYQCVDVIVFFIPTYCVLQL